ncbi:hypothetical protein D2962_08095 [Biomaibacter acetigenes]|uniref:Uncharacterized protein n=1 Tax=Biomaibacter acetigenes TaxID=2316383 RepID=A0A3G2R5G5_9FIRM|nr:hypothetical protein [Biomaibacter acetigenes]AYO30585.1 hypothetical protein D2962_08095 [Biomaibacter acetigenes]
MSFKDAMPMTLLEGDEELKRLVDVLDKGIGGQRKDLKDLFVIEKLSPQDVERWLKALGWKQNWQIDKKRLLNSLITLYKYGGTAIGIIKSVKEFTGIEVIAIKEAWPEAYRNGQSLSDDEKRYVSVMLSNYPYGEDTLQYLPLVEQICNFMKPDHAVITVSIHRNQVMDVHKTIGSLTGKTIRWVTYTPMT